MNLIYLNTFNINRHKLSKPSRLLSYQRTLQMAEFLLRKDSSNLNWKNKDLLTPLHAAVDKNHIDVVELLLKFGANINSIDCVGQTTLHRCAQNNNPQVSLVA